MTRKPVLIAGPTASGKSAVALEIAARLGGTIINADSMQVYRDLRVITARPTVQEEQEAPHRLYGHVDAGENYSVGRWCDDVRGVLAEVAADGSVPILVGGTGLYFKALTEGLRSVPPVPDAIRQDVRQRMDRDGPQALHAELARLDPASAERLKPADRVRIARALEVWLATGRPLDHGQPGQPLIEPSMAVRVFLTPDREALQRRINTRFDAMIMEGALDEVRALDARGLDPLLPAMKAHGVPWLRRHLHGEISLDMAAEGGKADTRRYTKRQMTWFRHQMGDWMPASPETAAAQILTASGDF